MEATYNLCVKLINVGKSDIVNKNIDLYLAAGRLTEKEYSDLLAMMNV